MRGQLPDAGEVGAPAVDRLQVDLEVARVQDHALGRVEGGGEGRGHRVGDGDELDLAGPDAHAARRRRPRRTAALLARPASSTRMRGSPTVSSDAVDGGRQITQQVRQPAGVVLVPVGEHDAVDPVRVLAQEGEVGQHEVDARACRARGT